METLNESGLTVGITICAEVAVRMASILRALEADLRAISSESKRRHQPVKEAADEALLALKTIQTGDVVVDSSAALVAAMQTPASAVIPEALAMAAASIHDVPKISERAVGALHRLLSMGAVPPSSVPTVVKAFAAQASKSKDQGVVLKCVQGLLALLTNPPPLGDNEEKVSAEQMFLEPLDLLLSMYGSAAASTPPSIGAILDQTIELAFRQVAAQLFTSTCPTSEDIKIVVFRDICSVAAREPPRRIQNLKIRRIVALEILEELMSSSDTDAGPPVTVVQGDLCPALHKLLKESNRDDRTRFLRVHQLLVGLVATRLHQIPAEIEAFLETILRGLRDLADDNTEPDWRRTVPLESLRAIGARPSLVASLARSLDQGNCTTPILSKAIETATSFLGSSEGNLTIPSADDCRNRNMTSDTQTTLAAVSLKVILAIMISLDESSSVFIKATAWGQLAASLAERPYLWIDPSSDQKSIITESVSKTITQLHQASHTLEDSKKQAVSVGRSRMVDSLCQTASYFLSSQETSTAALTIARELCENVLLISEGLEAPDWLNVLEVLHLMESNSSFQSVPSILEQVKQITGRVFGQADQLSPEACAELLSGLVNYSRAEITQGGNRASTKGSAYSENLFGIPKIKQVITLWLGREESKSTRMPTVIWELVAGHLVAVSTTTEQPSWRLSAVGVLIDMISLALQEKVGLDSQRVLVPLHDVVSGTFGDSRERALRGVHQVLESQGQAIQGDASWMRILEVLRLASGQESDSPSGGISLVVAGFQSIQLLGGDFLPSLSRTTTAEWIRVLGLYSKQTDDVNIALAAIGLFWRTADSMASGIEMKGSQDTEGDEHSPDGSDLWLLLYSELKRLSSDMRPEVRNVAIKTLTGALASHGSLMGSSAWELCLENSLLPMLVNVVSMEATTNTKERSMSSQVALSSEADLIQLHHSRDTPEKQWNESRVLAITGISRVVKGFAATLFGLNRFQSVWTTVLEMTLASASSPHKEVSIAGVAALLNLMNAVGCRLGGDKGVTSKAIDTSWSELWLSLENFVSDKSLSSDDHARQGSLQNEKAASLFAEGLAQLTQILPESFKGKDSRNIIQMLLKIAVSAKNPAWRQSYRWPGSTEVQISALDALEALQFGDDDQAWSILMHATLELTGSSASPLALRKRAVSSLESIYSRDSMPSRVKASQLSALLNKLTIYMLDRGSWEVYSAEKSQQTGPLCAVATQTLLTCLSVCMTELRGDIWTQIYVAVENFLFPDNPSAACYVDSSSVGCSSAKREWCILNERLDMKVITWIATALKDSQSSMADFMVTRFIGILERGGLSGALRIHFAHECQTQLFELARSSKDRPSVPSSDDRERHLSALCCKVIFVVADRILEHYVRDDRKTGRCPLPFTRRAEAITLLRGLGEIWPTSSESISAASVEGIYPRLCDCITSGDEILRRQTRDLLSRRKTTV